MAQNPFSHRNTVQRHIVLNEVTNRYDHPTADNVYDSIHTSHPKISKGTVYRNLKLLAEKGKIQQVKLSGADRFDSTLKKHCHIVCTVCGKVIDAPVDYTSVFDKEVSEKTGFKIVSHHTVFEGVCPECSINL